MSDCVFCKIQDGEIPSEKLFENDECFVIRDINPSAPIHLLIISKKHIESLSEMDENHEKLIGKMVLVGRDMAKKDGLIPGGFKTVINTGSDGGQIIFHFHVHVMGGKKF